MARLFWRRAGPPPGHEPAVRGLVFAGAYLLNALMHGVSIALAAALPVPAAPGQALIASDRIGIAPDGEGDAGVAPARRSSVIRLSCCWHQRCKFAAMCGTGLQEPIGSTNRELERQGSKQRGYG